MSISKITYLTYRHKGIVVLISQINYKINDRYYYKIIVAEIPYIVIGNAKSSKCIGRSTGNKEGCKNIVSLIDYNGLKNLDRKYGGFVSQ